MMVPHSLLKLPSFTAVLALTVTLVACVSTPETGEGALAVTSGNEVRRIDDLLLVDCLLPGQIRQLGTQMTYLSPRRRVKTTKSDCGIRGGEFVLFERSNYQTALQTLLPQAQSGDVVAQTYVGEIYERGLGLPGPDYVTAAMWYRKAAESGHSPAQTNLGSLYERGLGVPKQKSTALNLYRQAIGAHEDRVIFESRLKVERAAFRREIALRNNIASSLRKQLQRARVAQAPASSPVPPDLRLSDRTPSGSSARDPAPSRLQVRELLRAADSLSLGAVSAVEQAKKEVHAIKAVAEAEAADTSGPSQAGKKKPRVGKMELSLRQKEQEVNALQASVVEQRRLLDLDQTL